MGQLRHIAMSVPDPWMTAEFYKQIFGFEAVGETDSSLAEGVFLSDGVINMALLHFKDDRSAQGKGKDFVGLHHFGIWVDDVEAARKQVEKAGGEWIMGEPDYKHNSAYEVKFHDVNGVIFDLVHNGWAGTQRRPGDAANQTMGKRTMVARYAERRDEAAKAMAERLGAGHRPQQGQLRHIALATRDPWKTAAFYTQIFGFEVVGETDSSLAEGVFLSDGLFNIALLDFKTDKAAQGTGRDFVGFHHFGIWVDDVEAAQALVEKAGGAWLMGEPDYKQNSAYEVKFHDVNGVILDLVHNGWAGAQRRPGQADNQTMGKRTMVARYAERRDNAARTMAEALDRVPA